MSLLRRTEATAANNDDQKQQNNNQQQQQNNTRSNPFSNRFGNSGSSRFGSSNSSSSNNNNTQPTPPPPQKDVRISTVTTPIYKEVVRFSLHGLGDPFYHLLGEPVNVEYSKLNNLISALEEDNEKTTALTDMLDKAWTGYDFNGGALVYHYTHDILSEAQTPSVMPKDDDFSFDDDDEKDDKKPYVAYTIIRSMDPRLVLNVLARARSQILIASAPLLLSGTYIGRNMVSDDPRLVALAKATSYVNEGKPIWSTTTR
jgi:hypothetical protein